MEICRQGLKQISDSQANKARDFLTFQTAILAGDVAALRNLPEPSSQA